MEQLNELTNRAINTLRFLSVDGVQKANSGHPGLPMGTAAMAYTLWMRHLRHNPKNPEWPDRDRFILSGGHGSMLLYSLLHLTGYDLPLEQLKSFRQWNSKTPGHPEYGHTPGVEITTGPLGQGFANGVGMAIAESHLASIFNQPEFQIIDHYTYAIVTDGDLMEGVAAEAASLAGHLRLGKLIYLYDDNRITIDGSTDIAFTEDQAKRFEAYHWQVLQVEDGNDVDSIDRAISLAKQDARPSIIFCRTHIGYGLPTRQDTPKAHGEAPGKEELLGAKRKLGWPEEPEFLIPEDVLSHFRSSIEAGEKAEQDWNARLSEYRAAHPELGNQLVRRLEGKLPEGWEAELPVFPPDAKGMATRAASGKVINAISDCLPELVGGSADLSTSNNTWIHSSQAYQADNPAGRNFHYGVREHGMGAIVNGMAVHKGLIPYAATFLVFLDYMRGSMRLSALSHYPAIWIFTHDSIGMGEDGPTHQPVEHLAALRALPNLTVIRPADANEVSDAWRVAIQNRHGPTVIVLSRQSLPVFDRKFLSSKDGLQKGAYVLADLGGKKPQLILMASGSEVSVILEAGQALAKNGVGVRVVSFPSWELFKQQDATYRNQVLPPEIELRLAVEAGVPLGWERWVGCNGVIIGMESFGASAPMRVLMEKFGFTVENIINRAKQMMEITEANNKYETSHLKREEERANA